MALTGLSRYDTVDYVSNADPCKKTEKQPVDPADPEKGTKDVTVIDDGATQFQIAALDLFILGRIYDTSTEVSHSGDGVAKIHTHMNQTNIEAVQFGLRGWKNFKGHDGSDIRFTTMKRNVGGRSYEVVSDESMKSLSIQLVMELGTEIKDMSEVKATETKN